MTLPELLISISLMGILTAVLASAMAVTFRQTTSTEGRTNLARAEASFDTWLPADLASTDVGTTFTAADGSVIDSITQDVDASPCGNCGSIDLGGVNMMQLAWEVGGRLTRVQYQYIQIAGEWQLQRIACVGSEPCTVTSVLRDLGPDWDMTVAAPTPPSDPGVLLNDNAREVTVTINGGAPVGSSSAAGGDRTIKLTAGGRVTGEILPDEFTLPSFVRARSRCGGPVTLIVDTSGSISDTNMNNVVKPGVQAFIEAFRGTPTKLQIVPFSNVARAIGPNTVETSSNGGWHRYVDMTVDSQVDALKSDVATLAPAGGTNWEEAFFHTFRESNGSTASVVPNRVVFFTDGIPTISRRTPDNTFSNQPTAHNGPVFDFNNGEYNRTVGWPNYQGTEFHQESFDRADVILDEHRSVDKIFVGVGDGLQSDVGWIANPAAYTNRSAPPSSSTTRKGFDVVAHLLANGPSGHVPAVFDGNDYTNPETADFYPQNSFSASAFAKAMRAAALKDCGGTLTVQTRMDDNSPVQDEFVFENSEYRDSSGTVIDADPRTVTTSRTFRTGTFDFDIATSGSFDVDVVPAESSTLDGYTALGWTCRTGATTKALTPIPIENSSFSGFTVEVKANEAVSCILKVTK